MKSIAAFGDTGCRLKSAKTAAKEDDINGADARGKFQDCNDPALWPFAQVAQSVADAKPDLVIHVGDYLYRESACPAGDAGCARSPYGDDWPTWKADFFAPAAPALRAAPWIVVRGNHEICRRAGAGLFPAARSDPGSNVAGPDAAAMRRTGSAFHRHARGSVFHRPRTRAMPPMPVRAILPAMRRNSRR